MMQSILITNDPALAAEAQTSGISRLMVDLESIGKKERQASRNTFISAHRKEDIAKVRAAIKESELIVRINPWHSNSPSEVEEAIKEGANWIMLPMITALSQLDAASRQIRSRARLLPLVETGYSMAHIETIAVRPDIEEIYIGLNDLHLSLGLDYVFEPLALGLVDWMANRIRAQGKTFGFGGIGAISGSGELPAEIILSEHARLGSSAVILSSRFGRDTRMEDRNGRQQRLTNAITALQQAHARLMQRDADQQEADRQQARQLITRLAVQKSAA